MLAFLFSISGIEILKYYHTMFYRENAISNQLLLYAIVSRIQPLIEQRRAICVCTFLFLLNCSKYRELQRSKFVWSICLRVQ